MEFTQDWLNQIEKEDNCGFLNGILNWCNHRSLLYLACNILKEGAIVELGCGDGSTSHLHCLVNNNRNLISYDYSQEWLDKYKFMESNNHKLICDRTPYSIIESIDNIDICLVDHSPGEERWELIEKISNKVPLIVIHDTEAVGAGDYKLDKIWHLFKYRLNVNTKGACAALVSNSIDVTKFNKMQLGGVLLETRIEWIN